MSIDSPSPKALGVIRLSNPDVLNMYRTVLMLRDTLPLGKSREEAAAAFTAAVFVFHEVLARQAPATISSWKRQAREFVDAHPELTRAADTMLASA